MPIRTVLIGSALLGGCVVLATHAHAQPATVPGLAEWFSVAYDTSTVTISARPPGSAQWEQRFGWSEVTRVCFKSGGFMVSDGIYVFTTQRPESFVIPTEARGGAEFWSQIAKRGLFPADLMIKAASLEEGKVLCWPSAGGGSGG